MTTDRAPIDERKAVLRRKMRRQRRALKPEAGTRADLALGERTTFLAARLDARVVTLYAAHRNEAPLWSAFRRLRERGVVVLMPRVSSAAPADLHLYAIDRLQDLVQGYRGILEPHPSKAPVNPARSALTLIPGLAYGPDGERLGQGGGHYDRLLATGSLKGPVIGVGFEFQRLDVPLPTAPHDQPVDGVMTEVGLYGTGRWTPPAPHDTPGS